MRYINSNLFLAQVVVQLALIVWALFFDINLTTQAIISGVSLCSIGIPHGSNDYLYRKDRTIWGLTKFLAFLPSFWPIQQ